MKTFKDMIIEAAMKEKPKLIFSLRDTSYKKLEIEVYKDGEKYTSWLTNQYGTSVSWSSLYMDGPSAKKSHAEKAKEMKEKIEGFAEKNDKAGLISYLKTVTRSTWE